MGEEKIRFNSDKKFDIQLSQALVRERDLAASFIGSKFENAKIELKTETWQWRRTHHIAIEYQCGGRPSGISTTEADYWVHQVCDDNGVVMVWFVFPIDQLKKICRDAYHAGSFRKGGGDGGRFDNIILKVEDIIRWMFNLH